MKEFDLIVVGSGSGLDVASAAARQGYEVAVVEEGPLGGTCLNRGCIPSKMLIHRADLVQEIQRSEEFGIEASIQDIYFSGIVHEVNEEVAEDAESIRRGIQQSEQHTLYQDEGRFVDEKVLEVAGEEITSDRFVVAAGTRPVIPPVDGLEDVDYLTSKEALKLEDQPEHLVIIGGDYVAAELAHFFGTLGSDITIIEMGDTMVGNEDEEVSEKFTEIFSEKYDVNLGYMASEVSQDNGEITVRAENEEGDEVEVTGDELLVAAGRMPNTDRLEVEESGIETDDQGFVETDVHLETSVDGIYALGDVAGNWMFKHSANYEAGVVFRNLFGEERQEADYTAMPHAIFSSPQVAGVGKTEQDLRDGDVEYLVGRYPYERTGMGAALKEEDGFVKVLADHDTGDILGCHILGPHASVLIHEVLVAMRSGSGTVHDIRDAVHIHPALNEVVSRAFGSLQHPEHLDHDH